MFENRRRGRQTRNFTRNVPKILDLKSSSEQILSANQWRWVPPKSVQKVSRYEIEMGIRKNAKIIKKLADENSAVAEKGKS